MTPVVSGNFSPAGTFLSDGQLNKVSKPILGTCEEPSHVARRLNRNQLHMLPELLFQNNQALSRL
ncbi:hypothetical protein P7K49_024190 [Saguinus oedipus]|uniref:Uncharacterized protein n=1 Tax=Saguinus oedipus TaxID=9490 RepID=A0ABQ9UPM1_SAGOE|nr:hypothetical protein P7K49_024190 [Saguinus oedipus]